MSVLDTPISVFDNYKGTQPIKRISLLKWLCDDSLKHDVLKIRAIEDKTERDRLKAKLPAITVSGTFSIRNKKSWIKPSGLMCLDIDKKNNEHIENYADLKSILATAPFIAYCGLSVSGTGYFVIVPILFPEIYQAHFEALRLLFERIGIYIDISGKDVCRLRGYSYDAAPHFNHDAKPFQYFIEQRRPIIEPKSVTQNADNKIWVEKYLAEIAAKEIDVSGNYRTWLNLGFAISAEFGEEGREYFHQISKYYPGYDLDETDTQFTRCLRANGKGIGIGTFFKICQDNGISFRHIKSDPFEDFK